MERLLSMRRACRGALAALCRAAASMLTAPLLAVAWTTAPTATAAAASGDRLCDVGRSTLLTCVIAGTQSVADGSVLLFERPHVRLEGTLLVETSGHCSRDEALPCRSDAACGGAAGHCERPKEIELVVDGRFTVDRTGRIQARGEALAGDTIGPDGGIIRLTVGSADIAGTLDVSAIGRAAIKAGRGGGLVVDVAEALTVVDTARLDASTVSGGCGGTIRLGSGTPPARIDLRGGVTVEAATHGGAIEIAALDEVVVAGALDASNTSGSPGSRAACEQGSGGGSIVVAARRVAVHGRLWARGREAGGGSVTLLGETEVVLDSIETPAAVNLTGGDLDAFSAGGEFIVGATGGDVLFHRGRIEMDGQTLGFGSDGGRFEISAVGVPRCAQGGAPCSVDGDCGAGDGCVERGGDIAIESEISAAGGTGDGFGCDSCDIVATGNVVLVAPISVGGGPQAGAGGELFVTAGGALTVGPFPITANGADGGAILLNAGDRAGAVSGSDGGLRIAAGARVGADGLAVDGLGGGVEMSGCSVTIGSGAALTARGGAAGGAGGVSLFSRGAVALEARAVLAAVPGGTIEVSYGSQVSVAPDAIITPPVAPVRVEGREPCSQCGDGATAPPEQCDGPGSCIAAGEECVDPGRFNQCTCIATCGALPGIQAGEECDGADLGGRTCASEGFRGGTLGCRAECILDTTECTPAECGNEVHEPGEECDDGNADDTDACLSDCRLARCGDGVVCSAASCETGPGGGPEECDDGNGEDSDACPSMCVRAVCGDGLLCSAAGCTTGPGGGPEACDDASVCCALATCAIRGCADGEACSGASGCCHPDAFCDDGDVCTADHCSVFLGCVHTAIAACCTADTACGDGNPCTDDRCDAATRRCVTLANVSPCNDGNPCTRTDTCRDRSCVGGDPVVCGAPDQCHDVGVCDGATGGCLNPQRPDGTGCNDGDGCTEGDACAGGVCTPGGRRQCDDGIRCTADTCARLAGCMHRAIPDCCDGDADCDDSNACTGSERCDLATGICVTGAAPSCADSDACTADTCDAALGCQYPTVDFGAVRAAVAASLSLDPCLGQPVASITRLLERSGRLVDRAERAGGAAAVLRRLKKAAKGLDRAAALTARRNGKQIAGDCATLLAGAIDDAHVLTLCLVAARGG